MNSVSEIYQQELRKILRKRLKGTMGPTENVLYFPNDIDFRICPKNGISTIKWALLYINDVEQSQSNPESLLMGTKNWRWEQVNKYGYKPELPFRKNSFRVAVARDPVKRFMSACEYIKQEYVKNSQLLTADEELTLENLKKLENMSDVDILPEKIDDIIHGVWRGDIQNSHFFTQTYYHGNTGQYDKIFKMSNFGVMLEWLRVKTKATKKIEKIHSNKTSGQWFGGVDSLTTDQKKRIMRIYEEDYDYGWTED